MRYISICRATGASRHNPLHIHTHRCLIALALLSIRSESSVNPNSTGRRERRITSFVPNGDAILDV